MASGRAQMLYINIIVTLLHDVQKTHGLVFNTRALRLTCEKVRQRVRQEGLGFLTKTLPKLGKAFDKALAGDTPLNAVDLRFDPQENSKLPRFLGELFSRVLQPDGSLLPDPCENSVRVLREILFVYYKLELPYTDEQEQAVVERFKQTEDDLTALSNGFHTLEAGVKSYYCDRRNGYTIDPKTPITRKARKYLWWLFRSFDPTDIYPQHGPGAVATRQKLWEKYQWTNVSAKITELYPFDEYFCSSIGHVCDSWRTFSSLTEKDLPARVILVPKDSRGPRLISCEPVDYQWVQQGLGKAIVKLVESHPLTRENVRFTDQTPNQYGALLGSQNGRYATLDLKEASDRVSADLVRLLFPGHVYTYLEGCRSSSTVLPNGTELPLKKFAPMGSCLCFPVMALTIWAILSAAAPDRYTRERIYVYGDDVIVPTAYAADAIEQLEAFGLKVNRDKSCTSGLFRESCGVDAFKGKNVTPVRIRTCWSSSPNPNVYASWTAYAKSFARRGYWGVYDVIVKELSSIYDSIPSSGLDQETLGLPYVPEHARPKRRRWNKNLQKFEYYVTEIKSPTIKKTIDGWSMLLRYFTEAHASSMRSPWDKHAGPRSILSEDSAPFSVSSYTSRKTSMLVRRWR